MSCHKKLATASVCVCVCVCVCVSGIGRHGSKKGRYIVGKKYSPLVLVCLHALSLFTATSQGH